MNKEPNTPSQIHSTSPLEGGREGGLFLSVLASLIFFTRLPWWRLRSVPKEVFEHVVDWWPFVGWLTGGVMAGVFCCAFLLGFPPAVAALLAIASRLLLTGALHEDGLADFCDGFGGGTTRARTLSIMKDSHIGTYGVLGLIICLGLLWASIASLPMSILTPHSSLLDLQSSIINPPLGALRRFTLEEFSILIFQFIMLFDVAAKSAASLITGQLPYARTEEEAKNGVVYVGRSLRGWLMHGIRCALALALPIALCVYCGMGKVLWLLPVPFVVELLLMLWMRRRLGGYTGDCCGALFLLCELSLYLSLFIIS